MNQKVLYLLLLAPCGIGLSPKFVDALLLPDSDALTPIKGCPVTVRRLFLSSIGDRALLLVLLLGIAFLLGLLTVVLVHAARRKKVAKVIAAVAGLVFITIPFTSDASIARLCSENVWIPQQFEKIFVAAVGYVLGVLSGILAVYLANRIKEKTSSGQNAKSKS